MKLWTLFAGASTLGLATLASAQADDVALTRTPVATAIAQLDKMYGVTIVLRGRLADYPNRRVTLTADDSSSPASRFQAITDLADSLDASAVKGFVITKAANADSVTAPKIDSYQNIVFASATMPVTDAIRKIAELDGANVQIAKDISGTVTFPATQISAAAAAREVARQAHLSWKAYYAITTDPVATTFVTYYAQVPTATPAVAPNPVATTAAPAQVATAPANGVATTAVPTVAPNAPVVLPGYNYPAYGYPAYGYPGYGYDPTTYFEAQNGSPYNNPISGVFPGGFTTGGGSVSVMGGSPYYGGAAPYITIP
jgi:hypothetical protein